jgi:hypothetical protein
VNELPGNEAALGAAPVNQESGSQTAAGNTTASPSSASALSGDQTSINQVADGKMAVSRVSDGQGVVAGLKSQRSRLSASRAALALFAGIAAWLVPGLGHLLLGRWGRALVFFAAVGGLVISGYLLRGNVFPPHSGDPFGTLGFVADAGTGVFYYFSRFFEAAGPDVSRAAGDYGTRFIAAAGVVNVLAVLDTIEIATGRRS